MAGSGEACSKIIESAQGGKSDPLDEPMVARVLYFWNSLLGVIALQINAMERLRYNQDWIDVPWACLDAGDS